MRSAVTTSAFYDCATLDPLILKQRTEEFAEHLSWSLERILRHREESLRGILRHAVDKSPYFKDRIGHLVEQAWISEGAGRTTIKARLFWRLIYPALGPYPIEWGSLAFAVAFVAIWTAAAGVLYRYHVRIQV